jgi:hypothetical protein
MIEICWFPSRIGGMAILTGYRKTSGTVIRVCGVQEILLMASVAVCRNGIVIPFMAIAACRNRMP